MGTKRLMWCPQCDWSQPECHPHPLVINTAEGQVLNLRKAVFAIWGLFKYIFLEIRTRCLKLMRQFLEILSEYYKLKPKSMFSLHAGTPDVSSQKCKISHLNMPSFPGFVRDVVYAIILVTSESSANPVLTTYPQSGPVQTLSHPHSPACWTRISRMISYNLLVNIHVIFHFIPQCS